MRERQQETGRGGAARRNTACLFLWTLLFMASAVQAATVTVTSPNGGETWKIGDRKQITWSYNGGKKLTIALLRNGTPLGTIANNVTGTSIAWPAGSYQGGPAAAGLGYGIRVEEAGGGANRASDISDSSFALGDARASVLQFQPMLQTATALVPAGVQVLSPGLVAGHATVGVKKTGDPWSIVWTDGGVGVDAQGNLIAKQIKLRVTCAPGETLTSMRISGEGIFSSTQRFAGTLQGDTVALTDVPIASLRALINRACTQTSYGRELPGPEIVVNHICAQQGQTHGISKALGRYPVSVMCSANNLAYDLLQGIQPTGPPPCSIGTGCPDK